MAPAPHTLQKHMTYVGRPDISEAYTDFLGQGCYDETTLRMEFFVNRMNNPQSDRTLTGLPVTACRVIMPPSGVLDIIEQLIAVGTHLTTRPPHRTVRAASPHTAPTLGV